MRIIMSVRGFDFKFDGFFLSMLGTSVIVVSINWGRYRRCNYPLHIWIVVDYATVFLFRLLMFVDNGLSFAMGLDVDPEQRRLCFCGRIVILSCLAFLLYPFLWAWTVIGSLWFTSAHDCLPEEGQKWGFLIWLLFSYCGLIAIACISASKWLMRRQSHLQAQPRRSAISELQVIVLLIKSYTWEGALLSGSIVLLLQLINHLSIQVLAELIRLPEWALRTSQPVQEPRGGGIEIPLYHPGLSLTPAQREAVEALIQQLPKFRLKGVPTECSSCPICLEEFEVGTEVRGLPCAHNFHVACIDEWLRLNVKCPHCRCSVFPQLDLISALNPQSVGQNNLDTGNGDSRQTGSGTVFVNMSSGRLVRASSYAQSNLVRMQDMLRVIHVELPRAEATQNEHSFDSER
ncbi:hypothetical protein O6H91_19G079900 [Diphasiastrum complanatum]|uniref:Uncharacterized protein n=1 Tax=Diphasiastrum complanatum TaxID=34168 RepID=A0ACC2AX71_DIPCM|nr:hypothetical protein O6H91_19G079900 [Diphasiastrum complanatum]